MVSKIDTSRLHGNLSSAIRLFVLDNIRTRATAYNADRSGTSLMNGGQDHGQDHGQVA